MVDLDAIKARLNAATPGPWKVAIRQPSYHYWSSHGIDAKDDPVIEPSDYLSLDDAEFIANTPSDIAALIEEVERLQGELGKFHECKESNSCVNENGLFHTFDGWEPFGAARGVYHKDWE